MDQATITQQLDVILHAPVVTIIGACALIAVIWGIVNWAYALRIDALKERLNLSNDRLASSNDELDKVRAQLAAASEAGRSRVETKLSDDENGSAKWDSLARDLSRTILANEATISIGKPYIVRSLKPLGHKMHPGTAEGFVYPTEPAKPTKPER
jgi:hypothetical protein